MPVGSKNTFLTQCLVKKKRQTKKVGGCRRRPVGTGFAKSESESTVQEIMERSCQGSQGPL